MGQKIKRALGREERYSDAWTNLLALNRLATAWEPESCEVSHLVRFNLARTVWMAAWHRPG